MKTQGVEVRGEKGQKSLTSISTETFKDTFFQYSVNNFELLVVLQKYNLKIITTQHKDFSLLIYFQKNKAQ